MSPRGPRGRSGSRGGSASGGRSSASGPAPAGAFVAVVERRGRFLTAEPLFPTRERDRDGRPPRGGAGARLTLGPARSGRGGRIDVSAGQIVLVQSAGRGSHAGARVLRAIGRPDIARDVIEALLLDRGLARGFDPALEREARSAGERVAREPGERRDLRALPTLTIDPISARDFDDAISAEVIGAGDARTGGHARTGGDGRGALDAGESGAGAGGIRVWVHIADVAAHVPEGSPLDREARRRSTSVYAPGAVEPMLPHALSNDACSLVPGVDRAAVTVEMELHGAVVTRAAFYRSLIHSDVRLDYEQVDRIFAGTESTAEPWGAPLRAAREAAAALQREREQSGALVVDSEEPEFEFDQRGNVVAIHGRVQTESHRLIEHLMIAANEAVAGLLSQRGVPCLYRVHERPDPERVERLADQLASLDVPTPALPAHMSSTQAAELLAEMSRRVEQHTRRAGHGRQALSSLVLRSLKQAYYSPKNLGHAGLRSASYCHFTSPIRRYPDLVCHRALLSAVGGGERAPRAGELVELGAWTSERERHAMIVERDADDVARCFALERVIYERGLQQPFTGEITGLISAGAFIAFDEPQRAAPRFEGMLPVRLLRAPPASRERTRQAQIRSRSSPPRSGERERQREVEREWWELNEQGTILHGERSGATLRLGDTVDVRVVRVDSIRGRVDLEPPPSEQLRTPPRSPSGRSRSTSKR
ncbi:MAG TPA: RNB domain-containing ribonuclease [Solirubrobacteraceae bacterium]|nr:RNB domain-containing ribonuclease [Solirubrobacteraceae bacterium]